MSADEDTELRDLVAQTLEANGVLGKIKVPVPIHLSAAWAMCVPVARGATC